MPVRNIANAFKTPHAPELSSECPIFVFTEPIGSGSLRFLKNSDIAVHSARSPALVPEIFVKEVSNNFLLKDEDVFQTVDL